MKVTLKYFGMIAESAQKTEEVIEFDQCISISELKALQIKKYQIEDSESIQIAVNQNLNHEIELKDGDEVAFLPPFAGG